MRRVEWPPGSGRAADYEPHELAAMRDLREQHERGEMTRALLLRQVGLIHDLKVDLDATMLP